MCSLTDLWVKGHCLDTCRPCIKHSQQGKSIPGIHILAQWKPEPRWTTWVPSLQYIRERWQQGTTSTPQKTYNQSSCTYRQSPRSSLPWKESWRVEQVHSDPQQPQGHSRVCILNYTQKKQPTHKSASSKQSATGLWVDNSEAAGRTFIATRKLAPVPLQLGRDPQPKTHRHMLNVQILKKHKLRFNKNFPYLGVVYYK